MGNAEAFFDFYWAMNQYICERMSILDAFYCKVAGYSRRDLNALSSMMMILSILDIEQK